MIPELDLHDGMKLLDVGCGNGKLLFALAEIVKEFEFKGIDQSEQNIKRCQKKNNYTSIEFFVTQAEKLPFEDDYFDAITCTNAIRIISQKVRAIDEIHRVLKPNGNFYILEGLYNKEWKNKLDKILRQTKFIQPGKKYLSRSSLFSKSYLILGKK